MKEKLLYRMPELQSVIGLSKTSIYDLIKSGDFPEPIQVTSRSVAWKVTDIVSWIESRPVVNLTLNEGDEHWEASL